MNKEKLSPLIDGIYAIAMTIMVLELPRPQPGEELYASIGTLVNTLVDYGLSFVLLFALWYNQRRINDLVENHSRSSLWLNGLALMMVCLIPFSANLLYTLGQDSSQGISSDYILFIDVLFISICLSVDLLIHGALWTIQCAHLHAPEHHKQVAQIICARRTTSAIAIILMFSSFALPGPDRRALFIIPLLLMFEKEVVYLWSWLRNRVGWGKI